jgi:hypothetical protein
MPSDQTDITKTLNDCIFEPEDTDYIFDFDNSKVGQGVVFRDQDDGLTDEWLKVKPTSFFHNSIYTPNIAYMCDPTNKFYIDTSIPAFGMISWAGHEGWGKLWDVDDLRKPGWNDGVFYAHDSNSCDERGYYLSDGEYNMPYTHMKPSGPVRDANYHGSGSLDAGRVAGGGTGVHCGSNYHAVADSKPSVSNNYFNIDGGDFYSSGHCEINVSKFSPSSASNRPTYSKGVKQWSDNSFLSLTMKKFLELYPAKITENWEHYLFNLVGFTSNIHAMLTLQNALWRHRSDYNSECNVAQYRGWNEVPMSSVTLHAASTWGASCIVLPLNVYNIKELTDDQHKILAIKIDHYIENNWIKPGLDNITKQPGSYIVLLGQYSKDPNKNPNNFYRFFYGQEAVIDDRYYLHFAPEDDKTGQTGVCYLDKK